jgi:hypothetical protein
LVAGFLYKVLQDTADSFDVFRIAQVLVDELVVEGLPLPFAGSKPQRPNSSVVEHGGGGSFARSSFAGGSFRGRRCCCGLRRGGLGGFLSLSPGSFLTTDIDGRKLAGRRLSTRTPGATSQGKVHQPLYDGTGSAPVGGLFTKPFNQSLLRLVHPPSNQVLRKARGGFLRSFFAASNERTLDPGRCGEHFPFGDARQDPERREDLQGARDGAQSGGRAPLLSGSSLRLGPGPRFACTGTNAQRGSADTTSQPEGACGQERSCGTYSLTELASDCLLIPRGRGEGRLGGTSYPGDSFTSGTFLLLWQKSRGTNSSAFD